MSTHDMSFGIMTVYVHTCTHACLHTCGHGDSVHACLEWVCVIGVELELIYILMLARKVTLKNLLSLIVQSLLLLRFCSARYVTMSYKTVTDWIIHA